MATVMHWFRRDLRLLDNTALGEALQAGEVLPVFVLDPAILRRADTGANRLEFLQAGLRDLDQELRARGSRLMLRVGEPAPVLTEVAHRYNVRACFFNRDYEPYATLRDARVTSAMQAGGVTVRSFKDDVIAELGEPAGPRPFRVFTPFYRAWLASLSPAAIADRTRDGRFLPGHAISAEAIPSAVMSPKPVSAPAAGYRAAMTALDRFARHSLEAYALERDRLDIGATSRISPYLRFGMVSIRECLRTARRQSGSGSEAWQRQLAWRDFYRQLLAAMPRLETEPMEARMAGMPWDDSEAALVAWREGETGYPVIDAAMRQLAAEGWLPNRARLAVASFLVKDLGINWQKGELVFMERLLDGDLASNNGGWQWVAGSGADPQPFFRVFNPVLQGRRFDPHGIYVRRWCPEIAHYPDSVVHTPWLLSPGEQRRLGSVIGRDYPEPIVDHQQARKAALARFSELAVRARASGAAPRSHARS